MSILPPQIDEHISEFRYCLCCGCPLDEDWDDLLCEECLEEMLAEWSAADN